MKKFALMLVLFVSACEGESVKGLNVSLIDKGNGCSEVNYSYTQQDFEFLESTNFSTINKSAGIICADKGDKGDQGESCSVKREVFGATITCGKSQVQIFDGKNGSSCHTQQTTDGSHVYCDDGTSSFVAHGDKGVKGDTGSVGAKGAKGDTGVKGDVGSTGAKGSQGDVGTGCTTTQLVNGAVIKCGDTDSYIWDGKDGTNGLNGKDGTNGKDGVNGSNGSNGANGKDGDSIEVIKIGGGNRPEVMLKIGDICVTSYSDNLNGDNTRLVVLDKVSGVVTSDGVKIPVKNCNEYTLSNP